jgi:hypothetical protein
LMPAQVMRARLLLSLESAAERRLREESLSKHE